MKTFSQFLSEAKAKEEKLSFHQRYEKKRKDIIKKYKQDAIDNRNKIKKQKEEEGERQESENLKIKNKKDKIKKEKEEIEALETAREEGKREIAARVEKEHGIKVDY
jgi:hypothetical protein